MKKIMKKVTATISAAVMLAVPMMNGITASAASNVAPAPNQNAKVDYMKDNFYYRVVWTDSNQEWVPDTHTTHLVGDVNGDNKITLADSAGILMYIGNPSKNKDIDTIAADVDGNGYIERYDSYLIQAWDAGEVRHFKGYQAYYNRLGTLNPTGTYRVYFDERDPYKYTAVLKGDVNLDNKVTLTDAVLLQQCITNPQGYNKYFGNNPANRRKAQRASDVNNDGHINSTDTQLIWSVDAGVRPNFDEF